MVFPLVDSISQNISPSIEVQEQFKNLLTPRIKAVAVLAFAGFVILALTPLNVHAVVLGALSILGIGSIVVLALTVFQAKRLPCDLDAENLAKNLSQERHWQLLLARVIKEIPINDRPMSISRAELFFTDLMNDRDKFFTVYSLNRISDQYLAHCLVDPNLKLIKQLSNITHLALPLFLIIGSDQQIARNIVNKGENFCYNPDIQELIVKKLKDYNMEMVKWINNLNYIPNTEKHAQITNFENVRLNINNFSNAEFNFHYLILEEFKDKLGLDENEVFVQSYYEHAQSLNKMILEASHTTREDDF